MRTSKPFCIYSTIIATPLALARAAQAGGRDRFQKTWPHIDSELPLNLLVAAATSFDIGFDPD